MPVRSSNGRASPAVKLARAVDQTTCCLLSFSQDRGDVLFANVCAGFIRFCYGVCGDRCVMRSLGAPRVSVFMEGTGLASVLLHVHRAWATQVCLSQDTQYLLEE